MRQRACAGVAAVIARPEMPSNPSPEGPIEPTPKATTMDATAVVRTKPLASPSEADLGPVDNLPNRILLLGDSPGDSQLIESQGD
jgi:hypothetical protein